eukprot:CAMPEP_0114430722 /NCGR_PEP_ID=MMETSP0103-20121206/10195_1 /TAXON_ID=37642 ORGANISM="Paraphysomonas imperforata, Strain PA2" /NCGR_SAMPLE_ID=MMETSP0103 /ASSEMBLY_ACC=CAM_ASM_000201 /LENGTH=117 /DNA_ID=CAMNT_0001600193 /DNA_START=223 /DNA_END=576 /DNA_ORIENTATION=-
MRSRRTFCSKKIESTAAESGGEKKGVDIFMTAMRVMVVLGVLSSMSSNSRLMEEARANDKIATDLENTIDKATDSILKEEWRQAVKQKIDQGDKHALKKELQELLIVIPSEDEDDDV